MIIQSTDRLKIAKWEIRRNSDGEVRVVDYTWNIEVSTLIMMFFDGGNMDCDCNRSQYFEDDENVDQYGECGETRYSTVALIGADGARYTHEDPDSWELVRSI